MRIQSQAPLFAREGLNKIVDMYLNNPGLRWNKFVRVETNRDNFFRVATVGDFEPAAEINEGTGITYQDFQTPYYRDYYPIKRAIGFSVSTETLESAKYGYMDDRGRKMARAVVKAKEADCGNFINLATSSSGVNAPITPDGLSFANAAHLYQNGTFSNILTGNLALSVSSLATAIQQLMRQPSHTGDPMMFEGPYKLLVPPELADLANRLVRTQKYPTTNNNDINWGGDHVSEVIVNPYFTSTTAWALVCDNDWNPMQLVSRRPATVREQFDIDKDGWKYTTTEIWVKYPKDPRGFLYSAGA